MMRVEWEELTALFRQIADLYAEILRLSKQKKDVLVSGEHGALEQIIAQEETLLQSALELEAARETLLNKTAAQNGWDMQELTLSFLLKMAGPGEEQSKLQAIGRRLDNVIGELKEVNALNSRLTEKALFFVKCNINMLTQNVAEDNYGPGHSQTKMENTPVKRLLIDRKV